MKKTRKHKHAPTTHLYCGSTSPRLASTEPSTNPTTRSAASRATQPPPHPVIAPPPPQLKPAGCRNPDPHSTAAQVPVEPPRRASPPRKKKNRGNGDSPEGGWACAASGFAPRGEELSGGLGGWGTERRGSGMGGEESGGGGGGRRRRGLRRRRRRGENVMRSGLSLRWVNLIVSV
jgi:uncharacterized membrane protein YgcG